ncbi:MAG: thioredoxin family protein [Bacteroidaceae bacterium]|nr:thioredoxin family protein [Bacteroidaceae bacterium]MCI6802146.1 thioredoxin family protein [Prevotellaceae bacterium]MDD6016251.1 thioredoxin family protein [Prevotellaceae bacterium]MDD7526376.1 thioredoxin family protein [Prevotellaceae bacterium]MDY5759893.1 thioredoxin family protein [Bacteroidaceae bacterium]
MKLIIKIALGIILALFVLVGIVTCVGGCLDFDEELQTEEYEEGSSDEYEEESSDEYYEDEEEMDNNASNDNVAPGEESTIVVPANWGDGTCRPINAKQFYQLVASKKNYDTYIGEGPCVVDFWADWCGYCKQIDPYMKALAKKYKGLVQFYKVNADENEELMQLYGIDGLPTIFFCNGEDIQMNSGAQSQEEFDKMIQQMLEM